MNAYRVHYTAFEGGDSSNVAVAYIMHVAARTREEAVYKVFDELADTGFLPEEFRQVFIQEGDRWAELPTRPHATIGVS